MTDFRPSYLQTSTQSQRRKVFVSYSHLNQQEAEAFLLSFQNIFIPKTLGVTDEDDFINSPDTAYVMQRIRDEYIGDASVTIVLIGSCTHSRRYVDWEIKASLQQWEDALPNGLLGILLPSTGGAGHLPERFHRNGNSEKNCFARFRPYPTSGDQIRDWIEDAVSTRTSRAKWIQNPNVIWSHNRNCAVCGLHTGKHWRKLWKILGKSLS